MAVGPPPPSPPEPDGGRTAGNRLLDTAEQLEAMARILHAEAVRAKRAADECRNAAAQIDG